MRFVLRAFNCQINVEWAQLTFNTKVTGEQMCRSLYTDPEGLEIKDGIKFWNKAAHIGCTNKVSTAVSKNFKGSFYYEHSCIFNIYVLAFA